MGHVGLWQGCAVGMQSASWLLNTPLPALTIHFDTLMGPFYRDTAVILSLNHSSREQYNSQSKEDLIVCGILIKSLNLEHSSI